MAASRRAGGNLEVSNSEPSRGESRSAGGVSGASTWQVTCGTTRTREGEQAASQDETVESMQASQAWIAGGRGGRRPRL